MSFMIRSENYSKYLVDKYGKMYNQKILKEILINQKVTYTLEMDGKFIIIENVPARVNVETGEQFFSPKTVDRLQQIVWNQQQPVRTVTLSVYEYKAL